MNSEKDPGSENNNFRPDEGKMIDEKTRDIYVNRFLEEKKSELDNHKSVGFYVGKNKLNEILMSNSEGIRVYFGIDDDDQYVCLINPADKNWKEVLHNSPDLIICCPPKPCPPYCP